MHQQVENAVNAATSGLQSTYVTGLVSVAAAGMTLYLVIYGYLILAGKIQTPVADLAWDLGRMSLILMFVTNVGGLLDSASNAIEGLQDFASNGSDIWGILDTRVNNILTLAANIWDQADGIVSGLTAVLQLLSLLPLLLGLVVIAKELILTTITLMLLIIVMPIFIFCLMYGFIKPMFSRFLGAVLANVLKILFITVLSDVAFRLIAYTTQQNSSAGLMGTLIVYLIGGLICLSTAKMASELAEQLAEVSIEAAARGAASAGLSGGAGAAASAAKMADVASGGRMGNMAADAVKGMTEKSKTAQTAFKHFTRPSKSA
ncbi:TPA: type IV secretion system protein [Yersinia enterocolitica]|nr:type IV secretion system protein [Yersinia enterocolitica]